MERTNSDSNLLDGELVGELPADGSVYGDSEDDAFFDNILPGELDAEVADVSDIPRTETPQNSTSEFRNSSAAQVRSCSTSGSASGPPTTTRPARTAVAASGTSDPTSNARLPRLRLADAIRGGAPAHGSGPLSGDKRPSPPDLAGQKRQRTS
jgi:hypothetical protein